MRPVHHRPDRVRSAESSSAASTSTLSLSDVQLIEQAEGDAFRRFLTGPPAATRRELGITARQFGGAMATAMLEDPSSFWTKSVGLGFDVPITADSLTEIISFFRGAGKESGLLALAPQVLPQNWDRLYKAAGLVASGVWSKFACRVTDFVPMTTDLEVHALTADDTEAWAVIVREAFGMLGPDPGPLLRAVFDDSEARVFGARDGDQLVGAGAVYFVGDVAAFNTGATLPTHRRRGVQSALLTARAAAASDHGCRLLTAETGPAPGNPSYRNMVRAGLTHQYDRTNWLWTA